jgi:hypothetical protein
MVIIHRYTQVPLGELYFIIVDILLNLVRYWRYFIHEWKLVSTYYFNKYDLRITDIHATGMDLSFVLDYIARAELYKKKRDTTFDFMDLGGNDEEYKFQP